MMKTKLTQRRINTVPKSKPAVGVRLRRTPFRAQRGERSDHLPRPGDARCARAFFVGNYGSMESRPTTRAQRHGACSRQLSAMILRGDRNLTVAHIRKLATYFKVSAELFI